MKIKTETEFISFSDGVCGIFQLNEAGERVYSYEKLGFNNRVLGFKRYFEAAAQQIEVSRVIRIPQLPGVSNYDRIEINSVEYEVKMVQELYDTNPPSIDLTLDKEIT